MAKSGVRFPRLDQLLSNLGYGSRREAFFFVRDGRVVVEGESDLRADSRVDPARVRFDGAELDHPAGLLVCLHKPVGYVCSHDSTEGPTVYSLLPERWSARSPRIESVGRLDKDTSGLLLLTDQHEWVHRLTSPKKKIAKVYHFEFEGTLDQKSIDTLASGELVLRSEKVACRAAQLEILGPQHGRLTLEEGKYHQVRRMIAAVGAHVLSLHRTSLGHWELAGLRAGEHRVLPLKLDPPGAE